MYLDIYALQSIPPSNVNRDDTGAPKTAWYGGALRARVSSQSWKRAMRMMFRDLIPTDLLGVRTKFAVGLIAERIEKIDPGLADRAEAIAEAAMSVLGIKTKASTRKGDTEGDTETAYLVFIADREVERIARLAVDFEKKGGDATKPNRDLKSAIAKAFHGPQAVDISLFGRMLADASDLNVEACCQVAHALSVDRVDREYDFFTAIDDRAAADNLGAAMLDSLPFTSGVMYRYATVDIDGLRASIADERVAALALRAFVQAFACSMPSGKKATFANGTLPSTLLVALRKSAPVNLVGAFEDPVVGARGISVSRAAEMRLADRLRTAGSLWGQVPEVALCVSEYAGQTEIDSLANMVSLPELLDNVESFISTDAAGE